MPTSFAQKEANLKLHNRMEFKISLPLIDPDVTTPMVERASILHKIPVHLWASNQEACHVYQDMTV